MKQRLFKLGLAAALMAGIAGNAQADGSSATVEFSGMVAAGTCDIGTSNNGAVHLNMGSFAVNDLPENAGIVSSATPVSTVIAINNCSPYKPDGMTRTVTDGPEITLFAEGVGQNAALTSMDLWGDDDAFKRGIAINVAGQQVGETEQSISPKSSPGLHLVSVADSQGVLTVAPVTITGSVSTFRDRTDIEPGPFKATIVFSAVYN